MFESCYGDLLVYGSYREPTKMKNKEQEKAFFLQAAELLGAVHEGEHRIGRNIRRWGDRKAGPGRYPGCGVIRYYGPNTIHVALRNPTVTRLCKSEDEALKIIAAAVNNPQPPMNT